MKITRSHVTFPSKKKIRTLFPQMDVNFVKKKKGYRLVVKKKKDMNLLRDLITLFLIQYGSSQNK